MKIKGLLLGMFACAALAACTNDDIVEENGNGQEFKGDGYVAVEFSMAGNGAGRAATLDGFQDADPAEVKVTSATFFFLDASGNSCADPYTIKGDLLDPWTDGTNGSNTDKTSAPVIVMKNPTATPASMVAILNPTQEMKARLSLQELQKMTGEYNITIEGKFVMSNSVYINANGEQVVGAPVSANNIKATEAEAKADSNPVRIPVEKVVAKVNMVAGQNVTGENSNQTITGSDATTITAVIKGWWLDNTNSTSYLVKNLNVTYPTFGTNWWNDSNNKRSYWATSTEGNLKHGSYEDGTTDAKYCLENTTTEYTKMVVAAELQINNEAVSLIRWHNNLYTEDGFKTQIANMAEVRNYYICTNPEAAEGTKEYTSLTKENLEFAYNTTNNPNVTDEDWQAIVTVKANTPQIYTIVTAVDGKKVATEVSQEVVNASFKNIATFNYWKGGRTYFYTDIKHHGDVCGIVRNHLYNLTINSITGLGTPVPDPGKEIIPGKPAEDEESYIAAKVEILSYKVVSQNVDLE